MIDICIIGTGQIGSRHLQALKNVSFPIAIHLVDTSDVSKKVALDRYEQFKGIQKGQQIICYSSLEKLPMELDLVIIATNSDIRKRIIADLLQKRIVKYFLLEKLLFQKKSDYMSIEKLLSKKGSKAWVNCSMRMISLYGQIKKRISANKVITYIVSGNQSGLITNTIHFLDNLIYLTDCTDFTVNTERLNKSLFNSKRKGFLELSGTLDVRFENGSTGTFSCHGNGSSPTIISIFGSDSRYIIRESEKKMWSSESKDNWKWKETDVSLPYQSEMTTQVVEEILRNKTCSLPTYEISARVHLIYLEALLKHINKYSSNKFNYYPFT